MTDVAALTRRGNQHREAGRYAAAATLLRRALGAAIHLYGKHSPPAAAVRNDLAVVYKYSGQFRAASLLYRQALKTIQAELGSNHSEVATIYHNLGGLEHARRSFALGERYARTGLAIRRKALGARHPDVAADAAALAAILVERGKLDEAEGLYRSALRVWGTRRSHRYDVAVALNNLGALNYKRGTLGIAVRYYRRALGMKRRLPGSTNVDVAITLYNLGMLEDSREEWDSAKRLFRQALTIFEATLPAKHPSRAQCLGSYARVSGLREQD